MENDIRSAVKETKIAVFPGGAQLAISDVKACRWDDKRGCLVFDRLDGSKIFVTDKCVTYVSKEEYFEIIDDDCGREAAPCRHSISKEDVDGKS